MPQVSAHNADQDYTVNGGTERVLIWDSPTASASVTFSEGGDVQHAIIAPGGASGPIERGASGGASGGDVLLGTATVSAQEYSASIGSPGIGDLVGATSGGNASIFGLTGIGGGHGGYYDGAYVLPVNGGAAGQRASGDSRLGAAHPTSFVGGDAFRAATNAEKRSGGGRGAGGNGDDAVTLVDSLGGPGVESSITGSSDVYGRGGDGSVGGFLFISEKLAVAGVNYGDGASGGAADLPLTSGADGAPGAIILRFTLPVVSADPIEPTGIRQPAPQVPTATVTATTTVQPTGIRQTAPRIPQGALTATTTLQPDGIMQPAPQIPQGGLTASTTLEPNGIRQPAPRIPQANVGSSVSLSPVGIRQPAPQIPRAGLTAVTMLEPVGIRQPSPQIPQAELPDSALGLTGIRQPGPRIPQAEVTAATTINPTGIRAPGPRLPRLTLTETVAPVVVAIGAIIHATANRGPKFVQATAKRGPKIITATARRDV